MTSDRSVPLSEVLERFSDPCDWSELRSLEPYSFLVMFLGQPESEYTRLHWRYRELKKRLETEFLAKLTAGSLQASGLIYPVGLDAERQLIPAARWPKLEPDFAASEATGGGLRVVEIRVQEFTAYPRPLIPSEHSRPTRAKRACIARQAASGPPTLAGAGGTRARTRMAKKALLKRRPQQLWRPGD